jgi:hypothetical protein
VKHTNAIDIFWSWKTYSTHRCHEGLL